jgi:uncharacterized damage-inducible protein DinB
MIETETALETIYQGWEIYQRRLANVIAPLTPEQIALRAAPQLRPISVLVAHIISARVWWIHHILGEGNAELAPLIAWDDDGVPPHTATELADALEASWQLIRDALDHWTPSDLAQPIQRQVHGAERTYTRQWVVWHLIEHDLQHGGELSFLLGMHGIAAPDI